MPKTIPEKISREHIEEAIKKLDEGITHNFSDSIAYDLSFNGNLYPPKAVFGLACTMATGREFHPEDFKGGVGSKCFRILKENGFDIMPKLENIDVDIVPRNEYKRTEIHARFGGQRQGGISTPSGSDIIMIFSGKGGEAYGYSDGWTDDGQHFKYTGEGQSGDMQFTKGNRAIRDHAANGKRVLLFFYTRKAFVRYHGEVECIDYEYFQTPDSSGKSRQGIRFTFENVVASTDDGTTSSSIESKPKRIYKAPKKTERKGLITSRVGQGYYRQQLLEKFNNSCAVTGLELGEVLIASHIVPWRDAADQERLDPDNGILLSPNCDALFDRHLISFDRAGIIMISKLLSEEMLQQLRIESDASIKITGEMEKYLSKHRAQLR